tara:strand:- start:1990 stop:2319 length:330 start_codon:yes stop_codon:yes gene_type:complete
MSNDNRPTIATVAFRVNATRHMMNHDRRIWYVDTDAAMIARPIAMQLLSAQYRAAIAAATSTNDDTDDDDQPQPCEQCEEPCDYPETCDCSVAHVCHGCFECECGKGWD